MSKYTWDPAKAEANLRRHAIAFEEADAVASSPLAVIEPDVAHSTADQRVRITGWSPAGQLLVVIVSVERPRGRIISARRATKRERYAYEFRS